MNYKAVIVTYKTREAELNKCRKSLIAFGIPQSRIVIVDNTHDNKGFSAGVNKGIQQALEKNCDGILICNPDISVTNGNVQYLKKYAAAFGILGGVMEQHGNMYYGGSIDTNNLAGSLSTVKPASRVASVDFVSGSFMSITRSTINTIGYFSQKYFMYYEDVEYCLRAKKAGIQCGITTTITYAHEENSTQFAAKDYYLTRNRLMTLFDYGSPKQLLHECIAAPKNIPHLFSKNKRYKLQALQDALRNYI